MWLPPNTCQTGVLADIVVGVLNVISFSWEASPAETELEIMVVGEQHENNQDSLVLIAWLGHSALLLDSVIPSREQNDQMYEHRATTQPNLCSILFARRLYV